MENKVKQGKYQEEAKKKAKGINDTRLKGLNWAKAEKRLGNVLRECECTSMNTGKVKSTFFRS